MRPIEFASFQTYHETYFSFKKNFIYKKRKLYLLEKKTLFTRTVVHEEANIYFVTLSL